MPKSVEKRRKVLHRPQLTTSRTPLQTDTFTQKCRDGLCLGGHDVRRREVTRDFVQRSSVTIVRGPSGSQLLLSHTHGSERFPQTPLEAAGASCGDQEYDKGPRLRHATEHGLALLVCDYY